MRRIEVASKIENLFRSIKRQTGKAIGDFNLIEEGDRIAVAVSGGKDSYTLLDILEALRIKAPVGFELIAVNIDSGFAGYRTDVIEQYMQNKGYRFQVKSLDAYQIIEQKKRPGSSYCAFCARLRRGALYTIAEQLGCNKIALGHHLDDFIETLLLNQFYGGALAAMSPKLLADNGNQTVIRPLVYVEESDIIEYSQLAEYPLICCSCPVAGGVDQKRQQMKQLITRLAADIPQIRNSMIKALNNVQPRHLLDQSLQAGIGDKDGEIEQKQT